MKKFKVYIAGQVSGLDRQEVVEKFLKTQIQIEKMGFEVVNPVTLVDEKTPWVGAMRMCIAALMDCDAIFLIDDWRFSEGAKLEMTIANRVKIRATEYYCEIQQWGSIGLHEETSSTE